MQRWYPPPILIPPTPPTARQRARELANTPEFAHAQRAKKEGGSSVRRTQESDRAAPLAPAAVEVAIGTVLLPAAAPRSKHTYPSSTPTFSNSFSTLPI